MNRLQKRADTKPGDGAADGCGIIRVVYRFAWLVRAFTTLACVQIRDTRPAGKMGERPRENGNAALNFVGR